MASKHLKYADTPVEAKDANIPDSAQMGERDAMRVAHRLELTRLRHYADEMGPLPAYKG